ncbi:MAG: hypothetical protein ABL998_16825 [Planctomycetota bacterium]
MVKENDTIIGMGALLTMTYVQVNDSGMWTASVDTDFFDTGRDGAILRNGFVTLREGATLFAPPGAILDEIDSVNLANTGHLGLVIRIPGPKDAVYWNTVPLAIKDDLVGGPLVPATADWDKFDFVKINDANEVFVIGEIVNASVAGAFEPTLAKFKVDDIGNILSKEVLLTKGQFIPVLGTTVSDLPISEHSLAVNKHGDYMTLILGLGSVNAYVINAETVVAQEGAPSPIAGRTWNTLVNTPKLWLNDNGDYIHAGSISGTGGNYLIAKNGEKFAQSGDIYPTFSAGTMQNGSAAPLYVANDGNVFWRCDSSLSDDAFLRNFTPIIQQNVTLFEGDLVTGVEQTENGFSVSSNGRFFAGRVDLQLGGEAALFVDFGLVLPIPGCLGNEGELKVIDSMALPGKTLEFSMDLGHAVGSLPFILFSTRERVPGSDCGVNTPYGELLISNAHRIGRLTLPSWNGNQASTLSAPIPVDLTLVNQTFFAQGVFRGPIGTSPAYSLTNGLRIEIGAP